MPPHQSLRLYDLRKARGDCPRCGRPAETTHVYCPRCRADTRRQYQFRITRPQPPVSGPNLLACRGRWHSVSSQGPFHAPCCGRTYLVPSRQKETL